MVVNVFGSAALIASIVAKPAARNALLVGAKTVNIPPDERMDATLVLPVLALITAATKKLNVVSADATSTIFPTGGNSTFPIVCITPLLAAISACVTFIPLIKTPLELLVTKTESPLAVTTLASGPAGTCAAITLEPNV